MPEPVGNIVICSCEDTMPLDAEAVRKACRGAHVTTARQLCRAELERMRALAGDAGPLTIACTQEAALFDEAASEAGRTSPVVYANIREAAGWSREASSSGAKMAALLAAAAEPLPPVPMVGLESEGVILVYGRDERAVEAAARGMAFDANTLEKAETRLFALRAAARKYGGTCDALVAKRTDTETRLQALSEGQSRAAELEKMKAHARKAYDTAAAALSAAVSPPS